MVGTDTDQSQSSVVEQKGDPELTPARTALREVLTLWSELSAQERGQFATNGEQRVLFRRRQAEIIARHSVIKDFAGPIIRKIATLETEIQGQWEKLESLQELCKHPEIVNGFCTHCNAIL